jgi:penicillin-binding protein 1C
MTSAKLKSIAKKTLMGMATIFIAFLVVDFLFPLPQQKPWSRLVFAQDSSLLHATLSPDDKWRMHTTVDEVPKELVEALVAKEDRWFWMHPGVNPLAIGRAILGNAGAGKRGLWRKYDYHAGRPDVGAQTEDVLGETEGNVPRLPIGVAP